MDDLRPAPTSNIPEYTVSEISGAVKRTLEGSFGRVRVRGEITELKRHSSGHFYFALKDDGAKIAAIVWKFSATRLGMAPENGVEVVASGRISSYPERSSYQLIIDRLEYAGAGALLMRVELLRQRLAAEGLFDAACKVAIPLLPRVVGVITSEQGAVIHDIRTTIERRFPRTILLWPVPVQGEGAAAGIAGAIRGFDAQRGALRPDVLIVARGGGSLEDLMPFNEEIVLRAVADCRIPIISAVGHETDTTLIDHVADCRAPTPTAAAELAVPARAELLANLHQVIARLAAALHRQTQEQRLRLGRAERGLPDLPGLLGNARQRLDDRAERMVVAIRNLFLAHRATLARAEREIPRLPSIIETARQRLEDRGRRHLFAMPSFLNNLRSELEQLGRLPPPGQTTTAQHAALRLTTAHFTGGLRQTLGNARGRAGTVLGRLSSATIASTLRHARSELNAGAARLESVSPEAV